SILQQQVLWAINFRRTRSSMSIISLLFQNHRPSSFRRLLFLRYWLATASDGTKRLQAAKFSEQVSTRREFAARPFCGRYRALPAAVRYDLGKCPGRPERF